MKFDLTLLRNRDSFYLMGDTKSNYQYIITSALLHVRYVDIHSNILGIHQKLIANRPMMRLPCENCQYIFIIFSLHH